MNAPEKTVNYSRGTSENMQKNIIGRCPRYSFYNFRVNDALLCGDHKWSPLNWPYGIHILHILFHSLCLHHIIPDKWKIRRSQISKFSTSTEYFFFIFFMFQNLTVNSVISSIDNTDAKTVRIRHGHQSLCLL